MERALSKEGLLTRHLNIVSFGNGAAGTAAAAHTYFNVTPDKLTVAQAALLAGMVRNIAATDPVTKPQAAPERRNAVIGQMRDQQMIDDRQAREALASPLGVANPLVTLPAGCSGGHARGLAPARGASPRHAASVMNRSRPCAYRAISLEQTVDPISCQRTPYSSFAPVSVHTP
jgi:membrane peptidoglycan carboxypeptidase